MWKWKACSPKPRRADNRYLVDSGGRIDLGPQYGKVKVSGMTEEQAVEAIRQALLKINKEPLVSVQLVSSSALQPVTDQHLVGADGTVNLGTYGQVYVSGMTMEEATEAIDASNWPSSSTPRRSRSRSSPTTARSTT